MTTIKHAEGYVIKGAGFDKSGCFYAVEVEVVAGLDADEDDRAADVDGADGAGGGSDEHFAADGVVFLEGEDAGTSVGGEAEEAADIDDADEGLAVTVDASEGGVGRGQDLGDIGIDQQKRIERAS